MLSEYKKYMDDLAEKVKENGPEHSVRITEDKAGDYILEVFSNRAFQGLAESLFMTATHQGITVCLEENLCASESTLKKFYSKDFNESAAERFSDAENRRIFSLGIDPLVLDLDGDGVELSSLGFGLNASTTYFDIDNDGFAERTAWVRGGDGLLALDQNNNGKIDNQSELFGDSAIFADGFAALKSLDSNNDNKITSADSQWSRLRVWVDGDKDAVTDAGELKTLAALNITQINLNPVAHTNL
jgi:hypothetical protein